MNNIEAGEQSRREEFYEGARYALSLLENTETAGAEIPCKSKKPITNYDRIRNMSVEEMAQMLCETTVTLAVKLCGEYVSRTTSEIEKWLKQEAEQ